VVGVVLIRSNIVHMFWIVKRVLSPKR